MFPQKFFPESQVTLYLGDRLELLKQIPDESSHLIVTSPPYNIGKKYETHSSFDQYLDSCLLANTSFLLCLELGDIRSMFLFAALLLVNLKLFHWTSLFFSNVRMKLRNRIIWHFEHGQHCSKRFSGRYETILWFTKSDDYVFNLDPVRVPQKYPGKKHFAGKKKGQLSCNPLGKNPGDVWIIPNVKHNHVEKTIHPCQFPVELIERFVLSQET